jgi:hypothetical protein
LQDSTNSHPCIRSRIDDRRSGVSPLLVRYMSQIISGDPTTVAGLTKTGGGSLRLTGTLPPGLDPTVECGELLLGSLDSVFADSIPQGHPTTRRRRDRTEISKGLEKKPFFTGVECTAELSDHFFPRRRDAIHPNNPARAA